MHSQSRQSSEMSPSFQYCCVRPKSIDDIQVTLTPLERGVRDDSAPCHLIIMPWRAQQQGKRGVSILKQACSPEYQRAQGAFKDSMIHGILQFTLRIAFRCVLHRCESQEIRCQKLFSIKVRPCKRMGSRVKRQKGWCVKQGCVCNLAVGGRPPRVMPLRTTTSP